MLLLKTCNLVFFGLGAVYGHHAKRATTTKTEETHRLSNEVGGCCGLDHSEVTKLNSHKQLRNQVLSFGGCGGGGGGLSRVHDACEAHVANPKPFLVL